MADSLRNSRPDIVHHHLDETKLCHLKKALRSGELSKKLVCQATSLTYSQQKDWINGGVK
ncbi:hypothetical protein [Photobacterium rosenbergii]|uniref:hypothetical protein n=1 Tax=Photobacterium rosenbergii TaxID=294936 RepID=UPI0011B28DA2|nr:hypothetical protein [Photobacterium rosenbergii]